MTPPDKNDSTFQTIILLGYYMKVEQDDSMAARPQEESKMRKYFRYIAIAASLIFFLVLVVSAIIRKFGA